MVNDNNSSSFGPTSQRFRLAQRGSHRLFPVAFNLQPLRLRAFGVPTGRFERLRLRRALAVAFLVLHVNGAASAPAAMLA